MDEAARAAAEAAAQHNLNHATANGAGADTANFVRPPKSFVERQQLVSMDRAVWMVRIATRFDLKPPNVQAATCPVDDQHRRGYNIQNDWK